MVVSRHHTQYREQAVAGQIHGSVSNLMSKSDWLKLAKAIGLGFGLLGFLIGVYLTGYGMGSAGGYFDAQANGYAAQYPADTDQRVDHCFGEGLAPRDTQACVSEAVQSAHENQRTEQDLSAQRQSARWAWWIFLITLAQVPLTGLGLLFILRTIWQGQEAQRHAQKVSDAELRPWLMPDADITTFKVKDNHLYFGYDAKCLNIGKTVARDVHMKFDHAFLQRGGSKEIDQKFDNFDYDLSKTNGILLPNEDMIMLGGDSVKLSNIPWMDDLDNCVIFVVIISVFYRSSMDEKVHRTDRSFTFGLAHKTVEDGRFLFKEDMEREEFAWIKTRFRNGETS